MRERVPNTKREAPRSRKSRPELKELNTKNKGVFKKAGFEKGPLSLKNLD